MIELAQKIKSLSIGNFEEIDDFPMLWTWFEEDSILAELGHPRLHTDEDYNFLYKHRRALLLAGEE